jgi:hypothetical protein
MALYNAYLKSKERASVHESKIEQYMQKEAKGFDGIKHFFEKFLLVLLRGFDPKGIVMKSNHYAKSKENSNGSVPRWCNLNPGFISLFKSKIQSTDNST